MRVLIVSLYHPELVRGGSQRVALDLFEALQTRRAATPAMEAHLLSSCTSGVMPALAHAGTAISGFDGRADQHLFFSDHFDSFWQKQGDPRALADFARFLERLRPEVVHFQHFVGYGIEMLTLTRKVLPECRIVLTLHEFQAICAADGQMRRRVDGTNCTNESPARCHQCLPEHPPERFFLRKRWLLRHLEAVDAFTCPSRFMLDRYIAWGLPAEKLFHVTNGQPDHAARLPLPAPPQRHGHRVPASGFSANCTTARA
ncbi:MAG: glycosyltransferase [Rhodospirillales bacterium]|nr:glycosyltransferase [Rhodospirillales bacterium]